MVARKEIVAFIAVFAAVTTGYSQSDTLTLARALSRATESNLTIAIAGGTVRRSESKLGESKSARFPSLFARGHYLHAPTPGYDETVTNGGEYGAQVSAAMLLYDGGAREKAVDQAANDVARSVVSLKKTRVDVAFAVRSAYFDILRLQEEMAIRAAGVARLRDYGRLLEQLARGGIATESDLLKAMIDLTNAELSLGSAGASLRNARILLADMLSLPPDRTIEAVALGCDEPLETVSLTPAGNADVELLRHDETSSALDLSLAQGERAPVVSVVADAGLLGLTPDNYRRDFGYSILLSLDIPLFTWGAIGERITQKEIVRAQTGQQSELVKRSVDARWRIATGDLALARTQLEAYAANTLQAERNFSASKTRFVGGSGSNLEVLEASRLLMESQLNHSATLCQLRIARATLVQLSGQQ